MLGWFRVQDITELANSASLFCASLSKHLDSMPRPMPIPQHSHLPDYEDKMQSQKRSNQSQMPEPFPTDPFPASAMFRVACCVQSLRGTRSTPSQPSPG
jgi:hypothetical protein